jgi:hypothetical protein
VTIHRRAAYIHVFELVEVLNMTSERLVGWRGGATIAFFIRADHASMNKLRGSNDPKYSIAVDVQRLSKFLSHPASYGNNFYSVDQDNLSRSRNL